MYEERRNTFSVRDIVLQLLMVILFTLIMIWLFPTKSYLKDNSQYLKTTPEEAPKDTGVPVKKLNEKAESGVTAILKEKHPELFK